MNKPTANIICDSVAPNGARLTTFVVTFHRFILAELNTHCAFSRNSASSRAIPSKVMLERVKENPALPVSYGSNQPGMQAGAELDDEAIKDVERLWTDAATNARISTFAVQQFGLHKQVANRLLEPFLWHTAIVTATDFDNFFWQRCHPDAQPEMKALADAMQYAYYMGDPLHIEPGFWHLPFAQDNETIIELSNLYRTDRHSGNAADESEFIKQRQKALSVARCARVSYNNHDGSRAVEKDFDLYDKLLAGMHMSPGEHQGTPCEHLPHINLYNDFLAKTRSDKTGELNNTLEVRCKLQGKFSAGWHQLRKFWKNENRQNFIPNLPGLETQAEILKAGGRLW